MALNALVGRAGIIQMMLVPERIQNAEPGCEADAENPSEVPHVLCLLQ